MNHLAEAQVVCAFLAFLMLSAILFADHSERDIDLLDVIIDRVEYSTPLGGDAGD